MDVGMKKLFLAATALVAFTAIANAADYVCKSLDEPSDKNGWAPDTASISVYQNSRRKINLQVISSRITIYFIHESRKPKWNIQ
jgi:hypothetical protein